MLLVLRTLTGLAVLLAVVLHPAHALAQQPAPVVVSLPSPAAWKQHLERDILPFWSTPAALGNPVGNFPTFRCNDGSLHDSVRPCVELSGAPEWIRSELGRQYVRMISRQVYLYGVAFHLTGDPKYLAWSRAGAHYIVEHAFNGATGDVVSYWRGQEAVADSPERTSQDMAYSLVGLSFYYYLTRDPLVLQPILRTERVIRDRYYDPRLGLYRQKRAGPGADRVELVAQLDQANAYMLLLAPLLRQPDQQRWRGELRGIARIIRDRFLDGPSGMFVGSFDPKAKAGGCIFTHEDTDFGHTIKAYWMLYFIARQEDDGDLEKFARERVPGIFRWAFLPATGSWATQPTTCKPDPEKLDPTSTWWMAAELDQAALTFGMSNSPLLGYIPKTDAFWREHMVDAQHGEVWDEVTVPGFVPRLPKVHLWKNGFHTAERAMIGYIATSALRSEPVTLYYAFPDCKMPDSVRPYYYDGLVKSHTETPLKDLPGLCRVEVTFANVH